MTIPLDARLLATLRRSAGVHLSTSELAAEAAVPQAEIEPRLEALAAAGYDIERRPGFGFRLLGGPDRVIADDLWSRLPEEAGTFLREIIVFEETGSTNDVAAQMGRQGAASGVAIFAERQTDGRGRFGRRWESASHRGLWFSLLLRPEMALALWPRLTTWAAVSVAAAVEGATGRPAAIKWPNDVHLAGKKTAGILIELGADEKQGHFAVVGIGLNVNHEAEDFPPELQELANSMHLAADRRLVRAAVAAGVLAELARRYAALERDFKSILEEARQRSLLLGTWIQVRAGDQVREGVAEGLDGEGCLLLRTAEGACERLNAGEVTLRAR